MFKLFQKDIGQRMTPSPDWPDRFGELALQTRNTMLQSYYDAGTVAGSTTVNNAPLVGLDFETTGLDPNTHSIVSIGLVPFSYNRILLREARHWVVRPILPLHRDSVTFHGITHSEVRQAPDLSQVIGEVLQALEGRVAVVHHRAIERQFLDVALKWRLKEGIEFPVIDTMELESRWHRRQAQPLKDRLMGKKPPSIRLAESRRRYNLPYYAPHHALTDAVASAELLMAQLQHHFSPDTPISELWD